MVISRYLGPSIDVGPAMTAEIMISNGHVVPRSTFWGLTLAERESPKHIELKWKLDMAIGKILAQKPLWTTLTLLKRWLQSVRCRVNFKSLRILFVHKISQSIFGSEVADWFCAHRHIGRRLHNLFKIYLVRHGGYMIENPFRTVVGIAEKRFKLMRALAFYRGISFRSLLLG